MNREFTIKRVSDRRWHAISHETYKNGDTFEYIVDIVSTEEQAEDVVTVLTNLHLLWDHYEALKINRS